MARRAGPRRAKSAAPVSSILKVCSAVGNEYLRHDGPEHVLCFAPTRSGKGVGLVVPTLLTWPDSAIVHDIKGENWTLTAGWRARFGRVLLFDPTNNLSAAYNPLLEVRRGEWEVRDVQNIAACWLSPEALWSAATIGKKQAIHFSWAQSSMCFTPSPTRHSPASPISCPIRGVRSKPRCAVVTTARSGSAAVIPAMQARAASQQSEN